MITLKAEKGEKVVIDGGNLKPNSDLIAILGNFIRIEGLTIQNSTGNGISIFGRGSRVHNIEIIDNVLEGNFSSGLIISCQSQQDPARDILVESNKIYKNSMMNILNSNKPSWSVALSAGIAKNVVFKKNKVYNNYGEGVGGFLSDGLTIEENEVFDNFSVNIYLDNTTNSIVKRNLVYSTNNTSFYRFNQPANGIQIANETYQNYKNSGMNNVIKNNIILGTSVGFYVANYQEGGGLINSFFIHNTICNSTRSAMVIDADKGHKNSVIANNIFQHKKDNSIAIISGDVSKIEFMNNLWSGIAPPEKAKSSGDKTGDPAFVNPIGFDPKGYKLKSNSKAKHAGSEKMNIDVDFGNQERKGKLDIGAWLVDG